MTRRPFEPSAPPALLLDGARRGPLEDSGELSGYEEIMDALADESHPDHDEHSAWVADMTGTDKPFHPEFLDIAAVNQVPANQFRSSNRGAGTQELEKEQALEQRPSAATLGASCPFVVNADNDVPSR